MNIDGQVQICAEGYVNFWDGDQWVYGFNLGQCQSPQAVVELCRRIPWLTEAQVQAAASEVNRYLHGA